MKAAIYNPYLDTMGGGERYTLSFANALTDMGYEVYVQWKNKSILENLSKRFDIKINKNLKTIHSINKGDGYDVCFWVSDGSIPLLNARRNFIHFQVPFKNVNGKSLFNRMKLFRIEKIICNSYFTKKVIDKEYGVSSTVLYPPVDTSKIKAFKKENIILYVGRFSNLVQNKGQKYLIQAFKKLCSIEGIDSNTKLILAGGVEVGVGNLIDKLKKSAKGFNIEILKSPGFEKLTSLYGRAMFFWSASGFGVNETENPEKVEHFGISLVEAMSAGAVPLVYNAGGHKEIIENNKNGFLWNNEEELIKKTLDLIKNRKEYREVSMSAKGKASEYSLEKFKDRVVNLL